ncbi:retrovirus-related pol polyprotein from transposon RE1 [Tanacetum coccineum]
MIALNEKNKLKIVTGEYIEPEINSRYRALWERTNDMIISWILNTIVEQISNSLNFLNTASGLWNELQEHYSQDLWDECDALEAPYMCVCICSCENGRVNGERDQRKRLIQFLIGLDECYSNVRGQILLMQPMPTVAKAYIMIRQEEKQREGYTAHSTIPTTLSAQSNYSRNNQYNSTRGNKTFSHGNNQEGSFGSTNSSENGSEMAMNARMDQLQNQLNQMMMIMQQNSKEPTTNGSFNSATDGSIEKFKARLVAKGFTQKQGVDYNETFTPVAKMVTVRTLIAVAVHNTWHIAQLDINNAFLHGDLHEEVYMKWFNKITTFLTHLGFQQSYADTSLLTYKKHKDFLALVIYVDDIILTGNNNHPITYFKQQLDQQFIIKDLGNINYYLGIEFLRHKQGVTMTQRKYALELIHTVGVLDLKPSHIPIDPNIKINDTDGYPLPDASLYKTLVGKLLYLTITRHDLSYAAHCLSQFSRSPRTPHFDALIKVLRYIKLCPGQGLHFPTNAPLQLKAYCDMIGQIQSIVSRSSTEAEYRALGDCTCEITWIQSLLQDLQVSITTPIPIFCDNQSSISLASNPVQHARTKHIEIDCHFVRDKIKNGIIRPTFVPSNLQVADVLTKALENREDYFNICVPLYAALVTVAAQETRQTGHYVEDLVKLMTDDDLELQDNSGYTAFCKAALARNVKKCEYLFEKNHKLLDIPNQSGKMPLTLAALLERHDVVKYLYEKSNKMSSNCWKPQDQKWILEIRVECNFFDIALQIVNDRPGLADNARKLVHSVEFIHMKVQPDAEEDTDALKLLRIIWSHTIRGKEKKTVDDIFRGHDYKIASSGQGDKTPEHSSNMLFVASELGNTRFVVEMTISRSNMDGIFQTRRGKRRMSYIFFEANQDLVSKGLDWMNDCMVVATLIVTIAFAVAFTVTGGYNQEHGPPIFIHKRTFLVFVIADSVSLFSSSTSLLVFLSILTSRHEQREVMISLPTKLMIALVALFIFVAAMMVTFSASFFVLYHNGLKWVPILIAAFAAVPVSVFAVLQFPLFPDMFRSMYDSHYLFKPKKRMLYSTNPRF